MSKNMKRNSVLDIYITDICNLDCEYCYVSTWKNEKLKISLSDFFSKINLFEYSNIRFLWWEPMIRFIEIKKIVEYISFKNQEIKFTIITNWLLLNKENLDFFIKNNISLAISIHDLAIKNIFSKNKLELFFKYKKIIWFILMYNPSNLLKTTKIFNFLVKLWFETFSLSAISWHWWTFKNIDLLKNELNIIKNIILKNKSINISETEISFLKELNNNKFCKKTQVDKFWKKRLCTRFGNENFLKNKKNIDYINKIFDKNVWFKNCKDRWFHTCKIWWFLDNKDNYNEFDLVEIFYKLNKVFISFYKDIVKIKNINNFYRDDIWEIRFNLTEQCNLRCNYCYLDFSNKKLDINIARNIIDFYLEQEWKEKIISFFWWEPLLEFNIIKELVEYSNNKVKLIWNKNIKFKIATNWLLLDKNIINFLKLNNFEIHLSLNWNKKINDITRDNSFDLLIKKIFFLKKNNFDFNKIVILFVIFPYLIGTIWKNLDFIKKLWFKNILLEIYIWDKFKWFEEKFWELEDKLSEFKNKNLFNDLNILNLKEKRLFLDISTDWKINDNSLLFFNNHIDFTPKKRLDFILNKLFNDK